MQHGQNQRWDNNTLTRHNNLRNLLPSTVSSTEILEARLSNKPSSDRIQRVPSIFVPQNRIPVIFSSVEDSEPNSESSFYFCSTERNSESFLFCGTAGIPSEITICSGYSIFHGMIFLLEIPDPSSESSWYPSGELRTVFGMSAYTLSDETIKFFLVRCHVNILTGDESEG